LQIYQPDLWLSANDIILPLLVPKLPSLASCHAPATPLELALTHVVVLVVKPAGLEARRLERFFFFLFTATFNKVKILQFYI
jgi:hypothetical protein